MRAAVLTTAAAAVVATAGCSATPSVELPDTWVADEGDGTTLELRPDGAGTFDGVPVVRDGARCERDDATPVHGEVTWRGGGEDLVLVTTDAGDEDAIWAAAGRFGALNWDKLMVGICGEDTPDEELVRYLR